MGEAATGTEGRRGRRRGNGAGKVDESASGRQGRDGQEAVTQPQLVGEKIEELEQLCVKAQLAVKAYNDGIKKLAEKSGYLASNIRALVAARVGDKFDIKKRDIEQQMELFTEVGE